MIIETYNIDDNKIAEILSDQILINNAKDGLELLANLYFQEYDKIILHKKNICADFFDLKNGIAGEILQKFVNYRVRLAVIGDFSNMGKSVSDFIYETNKGSHIVFVNTLDEALIS